jgi:hypothetical protein
MRENIDLFSVALTYMKKNIIPMRKILYQEKKEFSLHF